jgi:hypothetical protein
MENKSIVYSRTLWVNCLTLIVSILGFCVGVPYIGPIVAIVLPILNIILRFLTNTGVKLSLGVLK